MRSGDSGDSGDSVASMSIHQTDKPGGTVAAGLLSCRGFSFWASRKHGQVLCGLASRVQKPPLVSLLQGTKGPTLAVGHLGGMPGR
jgi:hypothetical protein